MPSRTVRHGSRNLLDDLSELIAPVPMMSSEVDKFTSPFEYRIAIGCTPADRDAATLTKLNEPLVSQRSQRSKHGVVVDAQDRGEVARCWETLARFGLSITDGTPKLRCDLFVEGGPLRRIDARSQHSANNTSLIGPLCPGWPSGSFGAIATVQPSALATEMPVSNQSGAEGCSSDVVRNRDE